MPVSKPRALAHLEQAQHNHGLFQHLRADGRYPDWAVTALFYAALHLVEAYLVETSTGFDGTRDHLQRDSQIGLKIPRVYRDYSYLQMRSQWARYRVDKPKPTPAELQRYETERFAPIVAELTRLGVELQP
ncbi:MAG TPA: hypothetical protein VGR43_05820 [Dehalococcoidia bacterium]|jgi:hypothetical protein|nr:hypothetical protein [Dehalococcoidia bacterium]